MRKGDLKFATAEVGSRVSIWMKGQRQYGEVTRKVTLGNGEPASYLCVAWDDGSRAKYTLKSLYNWSSFQVEVNGLELAIKEMEKADETH